MATCKVDLQFGYLHQQRQCLLNEAESMPTRKPGHSHCRAARALPVQAVTWEFTSQMSQLVPH